MWYVITAFFVVLEPFYGMLENPERSGTLRNGTERYDTEPEVIDAQYGRGRRIRALENWY